MLLTFRKRNKILVFQGRKIRRLGSELYIHLFVCVHPGSLHFLVEVLNVLDIWITDYDVLTSWRWSPAPSVPQVFIIEGYPVLQRTHSHVSDAASSWVPPPEYSRAVPSYHFSLLLSLGRSLFFLFGLLHPVLFPLLQSGLDPVSTVHLLTHRCDYLSCWAAPAGTHVLIQAHFIDDLSVYTTQCR